MTVEHAHTLDNGVYQQQIISIPPSGGPPGSPCLLGGPAPLVEFLDEEHGGYKTPEADHHHGPGNVTQGRTSLSAKLTHILVLHDLKNAEVWRAAVFEGMASFVGTFVGILCTISTLESGFSHPVVVIAGFQGLVLSLGILASAPASGGHVNPLITWTEMLTGHITPVRAALYLHGQVLGSIVAAFAAKVVVGDALAMRYSLGGCYLRSQVSATSGVVGLGAGRAFLLEILLDFFVLFIAYSVALDPPRLPRTGYVLAPFMIGGVVGLGIFAGGTLATGYGGAGINPGRCIGPAVAVGGDIWSHQWVFWAGPALAGLAMAALYRTIPPTHVQVYKLRKLAKTKRSGGSHRTVDKLATPFANGSISGSTMTTRIASNSDHAMSQQQQQHGAV